MRRTFLVVVDGSEEVELALRYACRRALHSGGRVALLSVVEKPEFQHWMFIGNLMENEARTEAEQLLNIVATRVERETKEPPILHIREGKLKDELIALLHEDKTISVLVLAAARKGDEPGPLISELVNKAAGRLKVPVTVIPGNMTKEQIDAIT